MGLAKPPETRCYRLMSHDVFFSYARLDAEKRPQLGLLERRLRDAGYSVWRDDRLRAGEGFHVQLTQALDASRVVLVLWGDAAVHSEWVCDEAGRAKRANKLIPISIGGATPPLGFGALQTIPFGDWDGDLSASCYVQLLSTLEDRIGPTATAKQLADALHAIREYALYELSMDLSDVNELTLDAPVAALIESEDLDMLREDGDFDDLDDPELALWASICGIAERERVAAPQTDLSQINTINDLAKLFARTL